MYVSKIRRYTDLWQEKDVGSIMDVVEAYDIVDEWMNG